MSAKTLVSRVTADDARMDEALPPGTILRDAVRDQLSSSILSEQRGAGPSNCNNFHADPGNDGCVTFHNCWPHSTLHDDMCSSRSGRCDAG
jgi:hypothetical protein